MNIISACLEMFTWYNLKFYHLSVRLILSGAPLIAIHKGRYYKRKDGLALGPGMYERHFYSNNALQFQQFYLAVKNCVDCIIFTHIHMY